MSTSEVEVVQAGLTMIDFIRREKIYIWMLLFVVVVNLINLTHRVKEKPQDEVSSISTKSFQELGITEDKVTQFLKSEKKEAIFFRYFISIAFLGLIMGFLFNFIYLIRGKGMIFRKTAEKGSVSWGILDVVKVTIIILFIGYVFSIIEGLVLKACSLKMDMKLRMILSTFFIDIIAGCVILYFVLVKYKEKIKALGLEFSSFLKNVSSGVVAYLFIVPILIFIMIASIWVLTLLGYQPPPQPVFEIFLKERRGSVLLFLSIFVSVLGPIIEEMFFRGFTYPAIKKRLGVFWGVLISGAVFSLLHTNVVGFLPIMVLGMLMAYLYEASGSLVPSVTVHILHNSIMVGFVYFIKELLG